MMTSKFRIVGKSVQKAFKHSLYLVMSNARAVDQMVSLFGRWKKDPETKFEPQGLSKFKNVFSQLVDLRRWGLRIA